MEKTEKSNAWPSVAVICAIIISIGIYFGLHDNQPNPTNQSPRSYPGTTPSHTLSSTGRISTDAADNSMVYVTRTGACYHSGSCGYLRSSKIPMKLSEAKMRYRPCSRCAPPQ